MRAHPAVVEVWIRPVGCRRQAFYRPLGSAATWRSISVPLADKALKRGSFTSGPLNGTTAVSRETDEPAPHPMKAEFAQQASVLNRDIDALNLAAGAA